MDDSRVGKKWPRSGSKTKKLPNGASNIQSKAKRKENTEKRLNVRNCGHRRGVSLCGGEPMLPNQLPKRCIMGTVGTSYFRWRRSTPTLSVLGNACHWSRSEKNERTSNPSQDRSEQVDQTTNDTIPRGRTRLSSHQVLGLFRSIGSHRGRA